MTGGALYGVPFCWLDTGLKRMEIMSDRLRQIVDWIPRDQVVADVGCDHGLVPLALVERGDNKRIIASDVSAPSLQKLIDVVKENDLEDVIDCRVTDGLQGMEEDHVETIVIAGMGGHLIARILEEGIEVAKKAKHLLLSPHTASDVVRKTLHRLGFAIVRETVVEDAGKFYELIDAVPSDETQGYDDMLFYQYGEQPVASKHPVLRKKLCCERTRIDTILQAWREKESGSDRLEARKEELQKEVDRLNEVIAKLGESNED